MNLRRQKMKTRFSTSTGLSLFALVFVAQVGCGGKPASVSGTVTVDGTPLTQGSVVFAPSSGGMRASGIIQADGSYEIKTNRDAGLEVGEYDVSVVAREVVETGPGSPPIPGKYLAPKRYGNVKTSGLHYSVEKGNNTIDIELSSDNAKDEG